MSRSLGIVVQRYGESVTGGSESLARALAERLAERLAEAAGEVTVFTTCARDYVTWRNELPEGTTSENRVTVRRFRVEEERDLAAFNAFAEPLYLRAASDEEEQQFLRRQGPFAPRLVEALAADRDRFDAVLFFTYLYYPTVAGLREASERAVLVPTTHDEPPLRFRIYRDVFARPKAFAFLTPPEEALVRGRFDLQGKPTVVAGIGIEAGGEPDILGFRARYDVDRPYAIYAGRIDAGKGCEEMLAFYERYRRDHEGGIDLLLMGNLAMPEPRVPGVRYVGFLDEHEKLAALAGAKAVICPSPYESLSIVLLEALALGVPALVTARSAVLLDHARRSNAGLWYEDAWEFSETLEMLARDDGLRERLGTQGRAYVEAEYSWPAILGKYEGLIEAVARK